MTEEYENREFMIFSVNELDKIDFTQVLETSADTVRRSVDGTKTFIKWEGSTPSSIKCSIIDSFIDIISDSISNILSTITASAINFLILISSPYFLVAVFLAFTDLATVSTTLIAVSF